MVKREGEALHEFLQQSFVDRGGLARRGGSIYILGSAPGVFRPGPQPPHCFRGGRSWSRRPAGTARGSDEPMTILVMY